MSEPRALALRQQLLAILAASTGAVLVPVGALIVLAAGVAHVHDASGEAQLELAAKLERVTLTEEYVRGELDRIAQEHVAEPGDPARAKALASYQRVEQLILASSEGALAHTEA